MITSQNSNYKLDEAHQQDKYAVVGGKENLVCDSRGDVYPMGGVPPVAAPTAEVITGGGALTPNVGYSYIYGYLNSYQDCETAPSPASAFIGRKDAGDYKTAGFSDNGLVVYVTGEDLNKSTGYYNGQTLACEIVNDEYVATYSQWQYRSIVEYVYNPIYERGEFTINRPFFNVDPDPADQVYTVKIDELATEEGIVGGKSSGKNKLVLGPTASPNPADYRWKTIHITQGKGKGQKRIITDASQREDGLIEITVDAPWKEKPKFVDPEKGDTYRQREKAEGESATKRNDKFYKQYYSSEYVISDPIRYSGLAIDANVIKADDKGRRVQLSGLGHSEGLITGKVAKYTDNAGTKKDTVTVTITGADDSEPNDATYINKRFRIFNGAGAGLDVRIAESQVISADRVKLTLDTYGKFKKDQRPNGTSEFVIYAGTMLSSSFVESTVVKQGKTQTEQNVTYYPRIMVGTGDGNGTYTLRCCATASGSAEPDIPALAAGEAHNVETYNNGRCYITFAIKDRRSNGSYGEARFITRPILSATSEAVTRSNGVQTYQITITVSDIPKSYGALPMIVVSDGTQKDPNNQGAYFVYSDTLQDGLYTGWIAAFYNQQDAFAKGKKKVKTSRVAGYLDATGELLLCNGVPGVGEGWQCVLYSEYIRQIGSRVRVYEEDSTDPSYTSASNTRYFLLDYFASAVTDAYKDWTFEFLYGFAKKVKGKTIYQQDKNKKVYSVYAYDGPRRRIDCAGDENYAKGVRMKPAPLGNEFVTLYDPSSYIFKVFNTNDGDDEGNSKGEGNNSSTDGVKMKVTGIVQSPLPGFDKIRLYRASETTGTYRLVATLENKAQTYIDNVGEYELTTEADFAHTAPTPARYIASRNASFALAGTSVGSFVAQQFEGAYIGTQRTTLAPAVVDVEYHAGNYSGTLLKNVPLIGIRTNDASKLTALLDSETVSESLRLQMVVGATPSDGVICGNEKRVHQSTLNNKVYPGTPLSPTETKIEEVTEFYLNPTADGLDNSYANCTLRIAEAVNDGDEPSIRFLRFGEDITYDGASRKVTLREGTIKLRIKTANLGVDYVADETNVTGTTKYCYIYEPMPYSIYKANWQVYYENGNPYAWDGVQSTALTATSLASGSALLLDATIPPMTSDSFINVSFGGEVNSRQFGATTETVLFYFAFRHTTGKDPALLSYCLSELSFVDKWDWEKNGLPTTDTGKAFGTVAPLETNGTLATLYVDHDKDGKPVLTQSNLRCFINGYALLVFDKPAEATGDSTFKTKGANLEIQVTTAGAGLREKVALENLFMLDDGYGTTITGILSIPRGLLVFKDRGVYIINPEWKSTINGKAITCVTHEFGCIAPGSIAEARSGVIWMSSGGRIMRQNFSLDGSVDFISKGLQTWFDGDEDLAGTYVDTNSLFDKVEATYDADYGYYIIAVPAKKRSDNTSVTVILMFDEGLYQWYRLDDSQSKNSVSCAFRIEGRAGFCGSYGIYDFKPDRTRYNAWTYASRWRDDGNNNRLKLIKRMYINSETDSQASSTAQANAYFYKDQKASPEPNLLSWVDGTAAHPFYTNVPKAQIEAGARAYEWRFVLTGSGFVRINSIDVELRGKDDKPPALANTPNASDF